MTALSEIIHHVILLIRSEISDVGMYEGQFTLYNKVDIRINRRKKYITNMHKYDIIYTLGTGYKK